MRVGPLLIYGASGHGLVVADTAEAAGYGPVVFADDDASKRDLDRLGWPVAAIGMDEALAWLRGHHAVAVVGIGSNQARRKVAGELVHGGATLVSLVHPSSTVSPRAELGTGTVVFAGVVVQPGAKVGDNVILNTGCGIDHECVLGDHVHVSPGAHLGGQVTVGEGTHIGIGASVIQCLRIGSWATVGAGSAVVRDIPDGVVAYGVPAVVRRSLER